MQTITITRFGCSMSPRRGLKCNMEWTDRHGVQGSARFDLSGEALVWLSLSGAEIQAAARAWVETTKELETLDGVWTVPMGDEDNDT